MIAKYPGIIQVKEVDLRDVQTVAQMLQNEWKPLNIITTVKRFLWWKRFDCKVLFGQPRP